MREPMAATPGTRTSGARSRRVTRARPQGPKEDPSGGEIETVAVDRPDELNDASAAASAEAAPTPGPSALV